MNAFASLSRRRQIARLRRSAETALARFDLAGSALRLIAHDYNSTFRVDAPSGERFALRINLNAARPVEEVRAEATWVEAIAAETDVLVAAPRRTVDGDHVTTVPCTDLDREVTVVVYRWLDGRDLGASARRSQVREIGRIAATLHDHAPTFRLPPNAHRPTFDALLMDADDHLTDLDAPWFTPDLRETVAAAGEHLGGVLGDALTVDPSWHLIHGDLHLWNARATSQGVAVFDFDDCGFGTRLQDLAISAFYLRPKDGLERALLDGYGAHLDLDMDTEVYEAHIATRALLLFNELAGSVNASHAEMVVEYAATTGRRLRHYLDTGTFHHDPPA